jgi:hypothetical protein
VDCNTFSKFIKKAGQLLVPLLFVWYYSNNYGHVLDPILRDREDRL